jgi:small subunit ribosomal protein S6
MNQYEVAIVFDPSLEVGLDKALERVEKIFKESDAKVVNTDNWGKRKLAYPIKKHEHGIYVFYTLQIDSQKVQKIETTLNITEEVIRFLIVRPDLKKIAKAEAAQEARKAKAAEREAKAGAEPAAEPTPPTESV